jgi:multiple sugar transport system ATP-binding protein
MNFVKGHISLGSSASVLTQVGVHLPLAAPAGTHLQAVTYGIRPEHLSIVDDGIPAEVLVVEPTGSETQLIARTGGQDLAVLLRERVTVRPGDAIHLRPDTRFVHLFDELSGQRL